MPKDTNTEDPISVAQQELEQFGMPFSNYKEVAKEAIKGLVDAWKDEEAKTNDRRKQRYFDVDIESNKKTGELDKDEVFTPVLLVDSNIKKQQAQQLKYLTKSPRVCVALCNEDTSIDGSVIEKDFTQKARYNGWELPLGKAIDGKDTHAWDTVEILFDADKPGHFAIEHIGHENLLFPTDTKEIQSADFIVRLVDITKRDLIKLVKKNGFDPIQVAEILKSNEKDSENNNKDADAKLKGFKNIRIEKVFFKHDDGFVYVAWSCASICEGWLREPKKLFLGQVELQVNEFTQERSFVQLYETSYPVEPLVYSLSEDECIMRMKGRVDLDQSKAEAATSLLSSALTSFRRSSNLYWSVDGESSGAEVDEAQTDIVLKPNRVFNKKVKQMQLSPVDASVFQAVYMIIGQSQQEAGDTNYAVFSNKSTRKTSAEVKAAGQEQELLSGVGATLLSIALRNTYTRCFNIYRSRVVAGLIKAPQIVIKLLSEYTWTLKPAGDVDVLEREELIKRMKEAWPVYQNTGAKNEYLKKLTKLLFPDDAEKFIKAIDENEVQLKFIMALMPVLQALIIDPATGQIKQEYGAESQRLQQLIQQGMEIIKQGQATLINNGTATPPMPADSEQLPQSADDSNILELPSVSQVA